MNIAKRNYIDMKASLLLKQQIKINTLEIQLKDLQNKLKNGLYSNFIDYCNIIDENNELKKENKRLRQKIKELKEIIK